MIQKKTKAMYSEAGGFAEGDVVTRDGTDLHRVWNMRSDGVTADFECIQVPVDGWAELGEIEFNLSRRYSLVRKGTPS